MCAPRLASKDGKEHRYFSIVENKRVSGGVQTDGRELLLSRYTQPELELKLLLQQLKLTLPGQPPPKITAAQAARAATL